MEHIKPLVIVLSRNYSTGLGVIRSLGEAGYTVDLVASVKKRGSSIIASSSKYVRNSMEVLTTQIQGDKGSEIMKILMEYAKVNKEKMVLFPTDDYTASIVAINQNVLKEHFFMPGTIGESNSSLVKFMDKAVQTKIAKKVGLLTPLEWVVSLKKEIIIPTEVIYPCFVKPLQSVMGSKNEMAVCRNEQELQNHLWNMKQFYENRFVLIQEYLVIDKEYDLSGVCLNQEIIIPAVIEKNKIAQHEFGVTLAGTIVPVDVLGNVREKIEAFLKQIHYYGMFDMELNVCGDKIYFNEVNFRSGGPNYSYFYSGVNLPALFVKEITGERHKPEEEKVVKYGRSFVYEKVAWEDYIHSYITKQELKNYIKNADFTLLANGEDPKPGQYFNRRIRLSALKQRIKKFLVKKDKNTNTMFHAPKVVVAGCNYCNILNMSRDLGEAGYDIEVLRVYKKKPSNINLLQRMKPDSCSKYVKKFHEVIVDNEIFKVQNYLMRMSNSSDRILLVPTDDYLASIIDESYDMLGEKFILPNISKTQGEINRLMNKEEQKKLAAKFELPMLNSVLIQSINGEYIIPETIVYPCFIKPNVSMKSTKARMRKCNNREELKAALDKFSKLGDFEILVEEFADIKTEYSILGVSTPETIITPGVFKVIEGGHKERKGVTLIGEVVPCSHMQPLIDECNRFVRSLNYTGLFDIDLIETKDGKIYFIELNFRAGASSHVLTILGVNLPEMYANFLVKGIPIIEKSVMQGVGDKFVSEKILLEEYVRSDVSWRKLKKNMKEVDIHFIKDAKDPKPYKHFRKFYIVAALMRLPYKVRDAKH